MNEYEFQRRWDALQDAYDNQEDDYDEDEEGEEEEWCYEPDYEAILENRREWAAASYDRIYGGW